MALAKALLYLQASFRGSFRGLCLCRKRSGTDTFSICICIFSFKNHYFFAALCGVFCFSLLRDNTMASDGIWLGPLTTTWTMPSTCTLVFPYVNSQSDRWFGWRGERCDASGDVRDSKDCWPPRRQGVEDREYAIGGWGFYSPGVVCPAGYTTACSNVEGQRPGAWSAQFPLFSGETALGCCPTYVHKLQPTWAW